MGSPDGHLAENLMHFGRVLRHAGLPIGTDRILMTLQALTVAGLESRADLRAVLRACLVDRVEHLELFEQAFHLFWRDPDLLGRVLQMRLPPAESQEASSPPAPENRRLAEALFPQNRTSPETPVPEETDVDAALSVSDRELLRKTDFDAMTTAEWNEARRTIERWRQTLPEVRTRRFAPAARGHRLDWRALSRRSARRGADLIELTRLAPRTRAVPLVALVDISGSMSRYSRMFLHFLHTLTSTQRNTQTFLFGTRLTPVTRMLRRKDPDRAVHECVQAVNDWSGGTRIAACLHEFNRRWSRRVLGQGANVLLVTDGLERDDVQWLGAEAHRLALSCRRLIWLNPLLRYDGFEPRASGVRALLPHVDAHRPVHNLDSLLALTEALESLGARARPEHRNRIHGTQQPASAARPSPSGLGSTQ